MSTSELLLLGLITSNILNVLAIAWGLSISRENNRLRKENLAAAQFNWRQAKQWRNN